MSLLEHGTVIAFDQVSVAQAETPPTARQAYGTYLCVGAACAEAYLTGQAETGPEHHPDALAARAAWMEARAREGVPEGKFF
jgi:hypothetical protein